MSKLDPRTNLGRALTLGAVACLLSFGCGDDESTPRRDAPEVADAAAEGGADSPDAAIEVTESTLTGIFSRLDATIEANCSCYVEMGAYSSVDECLMWQASRPDWAACTASVVAAHPGALEIFQCLVTLLEETAECLASKPCDPVARAECGPDALRCLNNDDALSFGVELGMACPDITLLPRQQ